MSVDLGLGDADGFAVLVLGVVSKPGGLSPLSNNLPWFSLGFLVPPAKSPLPGEACPGLAHVCECKPCERSSPPRAAPRAVPLPVKLISSPERTVADVQKAKLEVCGLPLPPCSLN